MATEYVCWGHKSVCIRVHAPQRECVCVCTCELQHVCLQWAWRDDCAEPVQFLGSRWGAASALMCVSCVCIVYGAQSRRLRVAPALVTIWPRPKTAAAPPTLLPSPGPVQVFALETPESEGDDTLIRTWQQRASEGGE